MTRCTVFDRTRSVLVPIADKSNDTIPSADWDLSDIWYATSADGFTWKEEGVAVPRPPKPAVGWRSVITTDILEWKGKYYLYYQGFMETYYQQGLSQTQRDRIAAENKSLRKE